MILIAGLLILFWIGPTKIIFLTNCKEIKFKTEK